MEENEVFAKNKEAFEKKYGSIDQLSQGENGQYEVGKAKDGSKILFAIEGDTRIRLNSSYDPAYEAMRWSERFATLKNNETTFVIEGLLNGYFLRALMFNARPRTTYIVYEPSESMFFFVMEHFNISDIISDMNVTLVFPYMGEDKFFYTVDDCKGVRDKNIICTVTPGYTKNEIFEKISKKVKISNEAADGYRTMMGRMAEVNQLFSLANLNKNFLLYDFSQKFPKDCPVIIVAAGPSLLDNVEELMRAKGKAIVVAVDRAASVLADHDVIPDLIATVDPSKDSKYITSDKFGETYLLAAYAAKKDSLEEYCGRTILINPEVRFANLPGQRDRLIFLGEVGGSVATATFRCFEKIGSKRIILVGQDLAMKDNKTHAEDSEKINEAEYEEVEGIDGGKVLSRWDWLRFRDFFERSIRGNKDIDVIDATEGGALIHGSTVMTLREAIDKYCVNAVNVKAIFESLPHAQTDEEHDETVTIIKDKLEDIKEIRKLAEEVIPLCHRLRNISKYGDILNKHNLKLVKKVDEIQYKINSYDIISVINEYWLQDTKLIPEGIFVIRNNNDGFNLFRDAETYYGKLSECCDSLSDAYREAFHIEKEEKKSDDK